MDVCYPRENARLINQIIDTGCVISEYPPGTPPSAGRFPARNRIVAGMSIGVLVVEAATESGSLITARLAGEQGREVFAIPGSIHSPHSRGCHKLIKQGAKLVETVQDILEELKWSAMPYTPTSTERTDTMPTDALLEQIGFDPCGIDELLPRCNLPIETLSARLLQLELEGHLSTLPGGRYQRVSAS